MLLAIYQILRCSNLCLVEVHFATKANPFLLTSPHWRRLLQRFVVCFEFTLMDQFMPVVLGRAASVGRAVRVSHVAVIRR